MDSEVSESKWNSIQSGYVHPATFLVGWLNLKSFFLLLRVIFTLLIDAICLILMIYSAHYSKNGDAQSISTIPGYVSFFFFGFGAS